MLRNYTKGSTTVRYIEGWAWITVNICLHFLVFLKSRRTGVRYMSLMQKLTLQHVWTTCIMVRYRYPDRNMKTPFGMSVDGEDNLLVCVYNSDNVHMLRYDGRNQKILLSEKDGLDHPMCVSDRHSLVVGLYEYAETDKKWYLVLDKLVAIELSLIKYRWMRRKVVSRMPCICLYA